MREWFSKLRGAISRRPERADDLTEEIEANLDLAAQDRIAEGMPPAEAREAARRGWVSAPGIAAGSGEASGDEGSGDEGGCEEVALLNGAGATRHVGSQPIRERADFRRAPVLIEAVEKRGREGVARTDGIDNIYWNAADLYVFVAF